MIKEAITSNLNDSKRLNIGSDQIVKALNLVEKQGQIQDIGSKRKFHSTTFSKEQMEKLDKYLNFATMAMDVIRFKMKGNATSHDTKYWLFPKQDRKMKKFLGLHHNYQIINEECSKPNQITLYLGKKHTNRPYIYDVLNYKTRAFKKN